MIIRSNNTLTKQVSEKKPVEVEEIQAIVKEEVKKQSSKKRIRPAVVIEEVAVVEEEKIEDWEKEKNIIEE